MSKIGTKENHIADFISRNYDPIDAKRFFSEQGYEDMKRVHLEDSEFNMVADW